MADWRALPTYSSMKSVPLIGKVSVTAGLGLVWVDMGSEDAGWARIYTAAKSGLARQRHRMVHQETVDPTPEPHPDPGQEDGGGDGEAEHRPPPETGGAHVESEAEQQARREADEPVAEHADDDRGAGVADAAEDADRHRRQPVADRERARQPDQRTRHRLHGEVRRVKPGQEARRREKDDRGGDHEPASQEQPSRRGPAGPRPVVGADG